MPSSSLTLAFLLVSYYTLVMNREGVDIIDGETCDNKMVYTQVNDDLHLYNVLERIRFDYTCYGIQ